MQEDFDLLLISVKAWNMSMEISVIVEGGCIVHLLYMSIFLTPLGDDLYKHL